MIPQRPTFGEAVGALLSVVAVLALAYAGLAQQNEQALGALIAVVSAAAGYFLRSKVQPPKGG